LNEFLIKFKDYLQDNKNVHEYLVGHVDAIYEYIKSYTDGLKLFSVHMGVIATVYNSIGVMLKKRGSYDDALECHKKALNMRLALYPKKKHPDVAASYNNIGVVFERQGKYEDALENFSKALLRLSKASSYFPCIPNTIPILL